MRVLDRCGMAVSSAESASWRAVSYSCNVHLSLVISSGLASCSKFSVVCFSSQIGAIISTSVLASEKSQYIRTKSTMVSIEAKTAERTQAQKLMAKYVKRNRVIRRQPQR